MSDSQMQYPVTDLSQQFRQLEDIRQGERIRFTMLLIVGVLVVVLAIWVIIFAAKQGAEGLKYLFMALLVVAGSVFHGAFRARGRYCEAYKSQVIPALVQSLQPDMSYRSGGHFNDDLFYRSGLYEQYYNIFESEDVLKGSIGETEFQIGEIKVQGETTSYKNGKEQREIVTIFDGLFAVAAFPRECQGSIFVVPDFAEKYFGMLGAKFQKVESGLNQHVLRVDNPEFEKAFIVRATDPAEAVTVLTPELQEQILILRARFGNDLRLAFKPSQLFIAIPSSRDWFEPRLSRPASSPLQVEHLVNQLKACFQIVEDLNLNTRIWTKPKLQNS